MTGQFSTPDPERCSHYAAFASHLDRVAFDVIYWALFVSVIFLLFLASWEYGSCMEKTAALDIEDSFRRKRLKKCMLICGIYTSIAVVAVVMETYALLALQFCDGEDLMSLYWSTWTTMQIGALIAICGIMLAVFHQIRGNKNPPWALALGTPVLVVAGVGHAIHGTIRKRVRGVSRGRNRSQPSGLGDRSASSQREDRFSRAGGSASDVSSCREDVLHVEDSEKGAVTPTTSKLVGYTPEGGPIIQFLPDSGAITPEHGTVLAQKLDGTLLVAFKKSADLGGLLTTRPSCSENFTHKKEKRDHQSSSHHPSRPQPAVVRIQLPAQDPTPLLDQVQQNRSADYV